MLNLLYLEFNNDIYNYNSKIFIDNSIDEKKEVIVLNTKTLTSGGD